MMALCWRHDFHLAGVWTQWLWHTGYVTDTCYVVGIAVNRQVEFILGAIATQVLSASHYQLESTVALVRITLVAQAGLIKTETNDEKLFNQPTNLPPPPPTHGAPLRDSEEQKSKVKLCEFSP
jgi:hypothetical protein